MYKYANKIDALTAILKRLDTGEQLNPEQLAQDFHVGVRTIYRYLNHLQAAGYPIYFDKADKSYRFLNNFRLTQLKSGGSDEAFALHPINKMSGVAIATFRTTGECIHKNMAMTRLMGCPTWDGCRGNFRHVDWWRDSGLLAMADEVIETGRESRRDITVTIDKRERWIQAHLSLVKQEKDTYLVFLAQDLSPRMHKEIQVARFFAAMNQSPNLILVTDTEGVIEHVSDRVEEMTGYAAEELIGCTPAILKSGQTSPELYQNMWSTISRGYAWSGELLNRKKNGECYWQHLHIAPIRNHHNGISRFVGVMEDISRQKRLEEEIYTYAITDRITGLYNRKILLELGNRDIAAALRYGRAMTLLIVDIDRFKEVNDQFGYPAGNQYMQQLAEICRASVRTTDLIGRVGKDSFAILLAESELSDALLVAERIREKAHEIRINAVEGAIACTVSVGGIALAARHQTMEQLVLECEGLLHSFQAQQRTNTCLGFSPT
ncbi:MAG: diguanylate cyclase [Trichlorobacter sp.]|uniref:diguanylate cyclase n=1 Tax=Trichlorobacter sp. TaxID=2911007 RepID=UPI0025674450|nr:diguanylate cyclase [Trichlorobacter sp.]MDK9716575.1 diguanylate cyclase [Trichlorobacter sp.]